MTTATDTTPAEAHAAFAERLKQIKREYPQPRPQESATDWLDRTYGMFDDDPTWDDFTRFLEQEKQRDREATEREYAEASETTP